MWSGVLILGSIGVILSLLFRLVERWVLRWYHGVRAAERAPLYRQVADAIVLVDGRSVGEVVEAVLR